MEHQLPDNLEKAVYARADERLQITGTNGGVFHIMSDTSLRRIVEDNTREAIHRGLQAIEGGQLEDWDIENIKHDARHNLADNR